MDIEIVSQMWRNYSRYSGLNLEEQGNLQRPL